MKLYVLSRRHAERGGWCDACNGSSRRVARVLFVKDAQREEIRICAPCSREALRAALEKPRRKAAS